MRAGRGEAQPAVRGEEAAVGEAELARAEGAFELVGEGVPAVVAAFHRMVPACSSATIRSFGCLPPSGTPNSADSFGQLNRSRVVASRMTSSRPNAVPSARQGNVVSCGVELEARRAGCSPNRSRPVTLASGTSGRHGNEHGNMSAKTKGSGARPHQTRPSLIARIPLTAGIAKAAATTHCTMQ